MKTKGISVLPVGARAINLAMATAVTACLLLSACDHNEDPVNNAVNAAAVPPPAAPPYSPPPASQLYQLTAPIALFPDALVAQVLAGATYPDQIAQANEWLISNTPPGATAASIAAAANQQPWDVSVRSLTAFPSVMAQMANNIPWTTALGQAYYHDPEDVMNSIQVMRQRAQRSGNLKSSPYLRVAAIPNNAGDNTAPARAVPAWEGAYDGPLVVAYPQEIIQIEPAEPEVVYVPRYSVETIYGAPVALYPGYVPPPPPPPPPSYYRPGYPAPEYRDSVHVNGALLFGAGILVGAVAAHEASNWHSWGVNWGHRNGPPPPHFGPGPAPSYRPQPPVVIHQNVTYLSNSPTVINRTTYNVRNNTTYINQPNNAGNRPGQFQPPHPGQPPAQADERGQPRPGMPPPVRNEPATIPQMPHVPHFNPADAQPGNPVPRQFVQQRHDPLQEQQAQAARQQAFSHNQQQQQQQHQQEQQQVQAHQQQLEQHQAQLRGQQEQAARQQELNRNEQRQRQEQQQGQLREQQMQQRQQQEQQQAQIRQQQAQQAQQLHNQQMHQQEQARPQPTQQPQQPRPPQAQPQQQHQHPPEEHKNGEHPHEPHKPGGN